MFEILLQAAKEQQRIKNEQMEIDVIERRKMIEVVTTFHLLWALLFTILEITVTFLVKNSANLMHNSSIMKFIFYSTKTS